MLAPDQYDPEIIHELIVIQYLSINEVLSLSKQQAHGLAVIHMASLPDSSLTRLGSDATVAFYKFIAKSEDEKLYVFTHADGQPAAACVLSFSPKSIKRRMVLNIPMALSLLATLWQKELSTSPSNLGTPPKKESIARIANYDELPLLNSLPHAPEVLHIFADITCRGTGVGRKLMMRAEQAVCESGQTQIVVQTQADTNNAALKFYHALGYILWGRSTGKHKSLVSLRKHLSG